jgi:hypothetical protein
MHTFQVKGSLRGDVMTTVCYLNFRTIFSIAGHGLSANLSYIRSPKHEQSYNNVVQREGDLPLELNKEKNHVFGEGGGREDEVG